MTYTARYILLTLTDSLRIECVDTAPRGELLLEGQTFEEQPIGGPDGYLGFYDWLRSPRSFAERGSTGYAPIVALQLWIDDDAADLIPLLPSRPYITWECADTVRIWLQSEHQADEHRSYDQAFGESRVFRSKGDILLLSFEADFLAPAEIEQLRSR